jgi:hypothetical protein
VDGPALGIKGRSAVSKREEGLGGGGGGGGGGTHTGGPEM